MLALLLAVAAVMLNLTEVIDESLHGWTKLGLLRKVARSRTGDVAKVCFEGYALLKPCGCTTGAEKAETRSQAP